MNSRPLDDELVLGSAVRLVHAAQESCPRYAAGAAPITTSEIWRLAGSLRCQLDYFPFESDVPAMALPFGDGVLVCVNSRLDRRDRFYGARHELGHVLRGDVDGAVFLTDREYMSPAERACDLFAFADLVPGSWIGLMRELSGSWRSTLEEVRRALLQYAEDWPVDRLEDRAWLRLRLYRECSI